MELKPRKPKPMTRAAVRAFLLALSEANPDPQSELVYNDPFSLLVAPSPLPPRRPTPR